MARHPGGQAANGPRALSEPPRSQPSETLLAQHAAIFEAIETGDAKQAGVCMTAHLREVLQTVQRHNATRPDLFGCSGGQQWADLVKGSRLRPLFVLPTPRSVSEAHTRPFDLALGRGLTELPLGKAVSLEDIRPSRMSFRPWTAAEGFFGCRLTGSLDERIDCGEQMAIAQHC
ncbi:MAG: FCD domain-containing protein [Mesorhizobium sp.]|nr:MAG: FCD domain-containing protein [Mesorhizobium sp.]TIV68336.1 MAG: FCD domain-containing protein [Mesorhizobium sp.]